MASNTRSSTFREKRRSAAERRRALHFSTKSTTTPSRSKRRNTTSHIRSNDDGSAADLSRRTKRCRTSGDVVGDDREREIRTNISDAAADEATETVSTLIVNPSTNNDTSGNNSTVTPTRGIPNEITRSKERITRNGEANSRTNNGSNDDSHPHSQFTTDNQNNPQ